MVVTAATLVGHLIPLLPFLWLARTWAVALAIALSALVLFGVGVYSARASPRRSGSAARPPDLPGGAARGLDRYARRRRETWWRNEMGDKQSKFSPTAKLRRPASGPRG